ncbi:MAG: 50S ribosomal protein L18e [Candidatus Syntrophoarchaeum sp. WYZ-LMO15]|nr:MAG: 50S ribosomal protein L18e [Candidatus Syntrophoarchaeum sp. WYZ-LMO15]
MSRRIKTNPTLLGLIDELKRLSRENNAPIWRDIAKRLERPRRRWPEVNISRINRYSREDEIVVVPGKVLGCGEIDHPVTVAAFSFSSRAREKIITEKGRAIDIRGLAEENPSGRGVKIIE